MANLQIKYETSATAAFDAAIQKFPRLEDVQMALEWRLSRDPKAGEHVPDVVPPCYVIHTEALPGTPEIVAVYRFDASEVNILAIKALALVDEDAAEERTA